MSKMITAKDVADLLGVSVYTVYRLANKPGGLRAYKIAGCVRFRQAEVNAYVDSQVVRPVQQAEPNKPGRLHYVPGMRVV